MCFFLCPFQPFLVIPSQSNEPGDSRTKGCGLLGQYCLPDSIVDPSGEIAGEGLRVRLGAVSRDSSGNRRLARVWLVADDLSCRAVPVDLEVYRLTNVPKFDVVAAIDGISLHLDLLPIHIDGVGRTLGLEELRSSVGGWAGETGADYYTGQEQGFVFLFTVVPPSCFGNQNIYHTLI